MKDDGIEKKFFKAGEELPVVVHMPFGVTEEFLQAIHDAGVDKLSVCSAGWQDGGYDGRVPGHFPVGAEAGGEEAYRRLIAKADSGAYALVHGVFPLWELIYHGVILYTSDRLCQNHTRGKCLYKLEKSGDPRWMEGDGIEDPYAALKIVEFGGRPIFYTYKFADVPRIKKAWDEFVPVRHLQRELMESHREIAPDVFETRYEDGSRTLCNYRNVSFALDGEDIPPMGYVLFGPGGAPRHRESFAFPSFFTSRTKAPRRT